MAATKKTKTKKINVTEIFCAGFGGQGIMFMGKLLAQAGLIDARSVTWMPSYGAEVRGGTAYSMTKISDGEIASPIVTKPDILIAMNQPSLTKYDSSVREGGLIISNKSLIAEPSKRRDVTVLNIAMTESALKLGGAKYANMIALGALIKKTKIFPMRTLVKALECMMKGKDDIIEANKKVLEKGFSLVR